LCLQGVVVVYNLDPDTTEEQLIWIFSRFGDVRDIQQAPMRTNQKFIEFWDVRHAAAALRAMNRAELSRLPAAGPSLSAGPGAAGGSSSALAGMVGHEQEAAGSSRPKGLSGDGSAARTGDGGASSSSHAYAAAQVAAAMQQLEMEQQQQQQQPFQRSPGQPIPRPPSHDPQVQMAMQHADLQQQVSQRGMVRPVSGMLDRMHAAVSPPLSLGPLSQSWDASGNPGSLAGLLNRQQQQQQPGQQQQQQQSMLQQQQQQLLLQQLASGLLRGSRTDLSGLVSAHLVAGWLCHMHHLDDCSLGQAAMYVHGWASVTHQWHLQHCIPCSRQLSLVQPHVLLV
jgi:RNA recognition motif-containing protein